MHAGIYVLARRYIVLDDALCRVLENLDELEIVLEGPMFLSQLFLAQTTIYHFSSCNSFMWRGRLFVRSAAALASGCRGGRGQGWQRRPRSRLAGLGLGLIWAATGWVGQMRWSWSC
jgi:hypothetical protein